MSAGAGFFLQVVCAVYFLLAVALLLLSSAATIAQPFLCERRARRRDQPPVSIVLPIKLLEHGFDAAQECVFAQDYPHFDVTASSTDPQSEAARHMLDIFRRYPRRESRLLRSTARFAKSPKVDNLHAPFTQAAHDVILMKDSNTLMEPDGLAQHMRHLTQSVGLVCAIPVLCDARNLAAHIEAGIANGPHARMLYLTSALGGGFGVGKIMLFRRADFARAGGFEAISHTVGEDNALAKAMKRINLRTVFSHRPVRQALGRRRLRDVFERQLRWSVIRREDELYSFVLEPICQAFPAIAAAAIAAPLMGASAFQAAALTAAFWLLTETALSFAKGWQVSLAAPAIFVMREAVMLAVWVRAWTTSRVVWANDVLQTGANSIPRTTAARPAKTEG